MPREWTDDERRRADEEEAHYWDSVEEEGRAGQAKQEARQAAVEEMVGWFHDQFEDPQVETPRDSEDDSYIYPWGGPFEASDVLYGMFGEEHDEELIQQAVKSVESDGTTEWAPTSSGEYYEHPSPDDNESGAVSALSQLTVSALERLDALEAIVAALPGVSSQIGHNAPPEAIGIPPYTDEDGHAATAAIAETRAALATEDPNPAELATLARRFDGWGTKIAAWLGKKADLAVDEAIKNSVRAFTWSQAAGAFAATAEILVELAKHLLAHR